MTVPCNPCCDLCSSFFNPRVTLSEDKQLSSAAQGWLDRKRKREALKFGGGSVASDTDDGVLQVIGGPRGSTVAVTVEQQAKKEEEEEEDKVRLWEAGWKERYYLHKFQISAMDGNFKLDLATEYIKGLQWVLLYYYQGVPSWTWFFPYHYAPFASDLSSFFDGTHNVDFEPFVEYDLLLLFFWCS